LSRLDRFDASEPTKEILRYFLRHPQAADTLEGIVRWRLLEERVERTLALGHEPVSLDRPVAEEDKLDDTVLVQADAYVTAGSGLDMVCRLLNPRYKDWSSPQQQVYRAYLENQLELRRMAASQVDETLASAPASETHAVQIPPPETTSSHFPEAETPKSRQSLFALPPIVWFFLISFVIMVTACLVGLYFFSRVAQQ